MEPFWMYRSTVNSPHKGQWRGALIFSLICAWTNGWVNNRDAGHSRRHRAHHDIIVITSELDWLKIRITDTNCDGVENNSSRPVAHSIMKHMCSLEVVCLILIPYHYPCYKQRQIKWSHLWNVLSAPGINGILMNHDTVSQTIPGIPMTLTHIFPFFVKGLDENSAGFSFSSIPDI